MKHKLLLLFIIVLLISGCSGGVPSTYEQLIELDCEQLGKRHFDCKDEAPVYTHECYRIYENQLRIKGCYK